MDRITEYRKNAFSYYMRAVADYLKTFPAERKILSHLRRRLPKIGTESADIPFTESNHPLDRLLENPETDLYKLFQVLIDLLLDNPGNPWIQTFVDNRPVNSSKKFL